jgi:hypothetical protein
MFSIALLPLFMVIDFSCEQIPQLSEGVSFECGLQILYLRNESKKKWLKNDIAIQRI